MKKRFFTLIIDHPYRTLVVILLISIGLAAFIPQLTIKIDFADFLDRDDPAVQAMERVQERFGLPPIMFMVAVTNEAGIFNYTTLSKIESMQERFAQLPGVDEVIGPLDFQVITGMKAAIRIGPAAPGGRVPQTATEMEVFRMRAMESDAMRGFIISADSKAAGISIQLKRDADNIAVARQVIAIVEEYRYQADAKQIYIAGLPYMNLILMEAVIGDMQFLFPLAILVIAAILFFFFRNRRGVIIPFLVAVLAVLWTLGAMAVFAIPLTVISMILPVILISIGIASGIHVLNRHHEEMVHGSERRTAILTAMDGIFSPVVISALTTVAGFLSFLNAVLPPQRQFGLFTAVGVLAAMVLSLTLIPALLAILKPSHSKKQAERQKMLTYILTALKRVVLRYPRMVMIGALVLFIVCLAGIPLLQVEISPVVFLGRNHPVVEGIAVMDHHFAGSEQIHIAIDTGRRDGMRDPKLLKEIVLLEEFLYEQGVRKTISLADIVREMHQKLRGDNPAYYVIPSDRRLVDQLLFLLALQGADLSPMAVGDFSAGKVIGMYTRKPSAQLVDFTREVQKYLDERFSGLAKAELVGTSRIHASLHARTITTQITSLVGVIIAVGVIVSLLMGSLLAGLIALIPLLLTVAINFGIMAYIGTYLGIATLMIASITIGIGIDHAVHFISRFRQETCTGKSMDNALQATIQTSGRAIVYNALALALGFIVLLFSGFRGINDFGMLLAMTMVISILATFTVVPAILITWRPGFLMHPVWSKKRTTTPKKEG
ncbi:efflux RND transporter permease subunit [Candidatus Acetothermia bacterium]|jgi:predicted RND superfamily exporter protein|nr:efflux RND transporter permease subunit [Candidatus Acetothermia bacterium]MCI2427351.1 efflux RND transporter permease subunit [Candidatus Acetothermia bacterium]MCI2428109.1 efflux RND transporter permease subunit [Candidatus Acetothermia bacterium]